MSLINRSSRLLLAVCAISLIVAPSRAFGQGRRATISGVVSDSAGAPVVGARVSVDGASHRHEQRPDRPLHAVPGSPPAPRRFAPDSSATTPVPAADDRRSPGQTATANFRLNIAPAELERVVVSTGYGEQTKANVTGATRSGRG